jgi:hypothetical protein
VEKTIKDTEVKLPPHRRCGPAKSQISALKQEVSPLYLKTTQRTKVSKRIDCLSYFSLRPWLEVQPCFNSVPTTTSARRTNEKNMLHSNKKYK